MLSWVWLVLVLVTARMIPLSVDLMVVVFLSIDVGLAVIGPAPFVLLFLLLSHVRSIAPRLHLLILL